MHFWHFGKIYDTSQFALKNQIRILFKLIRNLNYVVHIIVNAPMATQSQVYF